MVDITLIKLAKVMNYQNFCFKLDNKLHNRLYDFNIKFLIYIKERLKN